MNRIVLISFLIVNGLMAQAQFPISEQAEISVLTLGPYQREIYSAFGHSAIRYQDSVRSIDLVYNYGVFDFEQENFYWNFAKGKMLYQLGMSKTDRFIRHYIKHNRYVIEQKLNLTMDEKQQLMAFLTENYKPENREYYYNYVYDNCATKVPEVLQNALPGKITYDFSFVEQGKTIRDLMDDYLGFQPWGDWIIDVGLGQQIDKVATGKEYLFLPDYVQKSLAKSTITHQSGEEPLIAETINLYVPTPEMNENGWFTPFNFFVIAFFVVGFITNRDFKREKRTKWIDPVVFTLAGIMGWWLVFLWFGTVHLSQNNLNVLWAIPLHVPFAYMLGFKKFQPFLSQYFKWVSLGYIVLIVVWSLLPQPMHIALIPLILTMILRGFYIYFDLQKQLKKARR